MAHPSDPGFVVLHTLRVKGLAETAALTDSTDLGPGVIEEWLAKLVADGLVEHRDGRVPGWVLTTDGRAVHAEQCMVELARSGSRREVEDAYRSFRELNEGVLAACTDWQIRPVAATGASRDAHLVNDHADAAYDAAVLARLGQLDRQAQLLCSMLAEALGRFGGYGPRLSRALARTRAGDAAWLTAPLISSYHTVWFELHEDLLATLGIQRAQEASP